MYNPPNAEPVILERLPGSSAEGRQALSWVHTKSLYRLTDASRAVLEGCTPEMAGGAAAAAAALPPAYAPPEVRVSRTLV